MKAVILILFLCVTWSGKAQKPVSYTPDSLKKGDYLTIEAVRYHPETGPGIKEPVPWRAENIRRVILQATVTESNADNLTIDYTLESVYDCRNDSQKPGFYLFDSRYQKDFAFEDSTKNNLLSRIRYDRKSGKVLQTENKNTYYSYSKVYVPFGTRQEDLSSYSIKPVRDTLQTDQITGRIIPHLLIGWKHSGMLLSIPETMQPIPYRRIIDASFPLAPNTEFTCSYYDPDLLKDVTANRKIFLAYPTAYKEGKVTTILLTPGDSVTQYRTTFAGVTTDRYLGQGRGSEQNKYATDFQRLAYGYYHYDTSTPAKLRRAFHMRDSIYPIVLKDLFNKLDPYWKRVFELSEQYAKNTAILSSYSNAENKEEWLQSGLLDWDTPNFAVVNPLIDHAYSQRENDLSYYSAFLYYYNAFKKQELMADNLNLNRQKVLTSQESYILNKQYLSGYPLYLANATDLMNMICTRMLCEVDEEYTDFITACPDTALTGLLRKTYNKLLPLEAGNNIRESGLLITDSLRLAKGSDRKYILLYLNIGRISKNYSVDKALQWDRQLKAEELSSVVRLELFGQLTSYDTEQVKRLYKVTPFKQLVDLYYGWGVSSLAILMREDGTILSRQANDFDLNAMLKLVRKDRADIEHARTQSMKDFGKGMLWALLTGGIIGSFVVYLFNARRKREQHRRQICELELRAIRSQMNPHFIFNALSSIQNLISRAANDEANEYLVNFSRLLRKVLATSEKKLVPLSDEIEQIQLYLKLEQLRFPFIYSLTVDENIQPDLIEIPGMLIQPFVENAVKHGIAPRGEGEIDIQLSLQNQLLVIRITDDGPGIDAGRNDGFGIRAISSQFEILKTIYNTEIDIRIENRPDAASGCRVTLSIPL